MDLTVYCSDTIISLHISHPNRHDIEITNQINLLHVHVASQYWSFQFSLWLQLWPCSSAILSKRDTYISLKKSNDRKGIQTLNLI